MAVSLRRERSIEQSKTRVRYRPVAVSSCDSYVLALVCSSSNEYHLTLWDEESHNFCSAELDVESAKVIVECLFVEV